MFIFSYFVKNFEDTNQHFDLHSYYSNPIQVTQASALYTARATFVRWEVNHNEVAQASKSQRLYGQPRARLLQLRRSNRHVHAPAFNYKTDMLYFLFKYYHYSYSINSTFRYFFFVFIRKSLLATRIHSHHPWATSTAGAHHYLATVKPVEYSTNALANVNLLRYYFPSKRLPRRFFFWLFATYVLSVYPGMQDAMYDKYTYLHTSLPQLDLMFFFTVHTPENTSPHYYYYKRLPTPNLF